MTEVEKMVLSLLQESNIYKVVIDESEELRQLFLRELESIEDDSLLMSESNHERKMNKIRVKNEMIELYKRG